MENEPHYPYTLQDLETDDASDQIETVQRIGVNIDSLEQPATR